MLTLNLAFSESKVRVSCSITDRYLRLISWDVVTEPWFYNLRSAVSKSGGG